MRTVVIKLGSSIVAGEEGELREEVLGRVCDTVAALHVAGDECVVVSSGAIARGVRTMGLPTRPTTIPELQAASAVGQGKVYRVYDELLRARGVTSAQVLLTAGDVAGRTQYLNARHTLRQLLDWRVVPVANENDTTATDEISFGDNDFLAAHLAVLVAAQSARAADRHRRPAHGRPAPRPGRAAGPLTCTTWPSSTRLRSGTPPRRWAPGGCARRCSPLRSRAPRGSPR